MTNNPTVTKDIHKLVTRAAYNSFYDSPRELYHDIYDRLQKLGLDLSRVDKKTPKLTCVIKQNLLTDMLLVLSQLTRTRKMLGNMLMADEPTRVKIGGVRYYTFDGFSYPSVTAIVNGFDPFKHKHIAKWKENLFAEFPEKVATRKIEIATKIGNFAHVSLEQYLLSSCKDSKLCDRTIARYIKPFLDQIDEVLAIELPLYSHQYQFAGTADAILKMKNGKTYLVDFKTSSQKRTPSNSKHYFCQAAAYAHALKELHGIRVDGLCLAVMYKDRKGVKEHDLLASYYGRAADKNLFEPVRSSILIDYDVKKHLQAFVDLRANFEEPIEASDDYFDF